MTRPKWSGAAGKAALLASMYLCQAIPLGFVFGSLPVIMRQARMPLAGVGLLFILHLPWAVKFLYAPWVDNRHIPALGRRRSWIFPLQWLGGILLMAVAAAPPETRFPFMYALFMGLNIAMATNDIAVDGYATDILAPTERSWGNAIQAGARFAGMMFGGGLMLALYGSLGWAWVCRALACIVFLLSLPVFLHREMPRVAGKATSGRNRERGCVIRFLRRPEVRWLLVVLIAPTWFLFSGAMLRTSLLSDLGLDAGAIGGLLMTWAYPAGLAGTLAGGWLLAHIGTKPFMRLTFAGAVAVTAMAALFALKGSIAPWQAGLMLCLDNVLFGTIHVWAYSQMMRVSAGPNAGTGFAVLSSLFIFFPLAGGPLVGGLGDRMGFPALYALLTMLLLAGIAVAEIVVWYRGAMVLSSSGEDEGHGSLPPRSVRDAQGVVR